MTGMTLALPAFLRFLRARLDDEERGAQAAHGPVDGPLCVKWWTPEEIKTRLCDDQIHMSDAGHMAYWTPSRVLAGVEAKRETIRLYEGAVEFVESMKEHGIDATHYKVAAESYLNVMRRDAFVYAGHEDYDESWRP